MQTSSLCSLCRKGAMVSDPESGETICGNCGIVLSDRAAETRAEWRNFGSDTMYTGRTGDPSSLARHDMGLVTIIGKKSVDARGMLLNSEVRSAIARWRTWDGRVQSQSSSDRSLQRAFDILNRLKNKLNLSSSMIEKAAYIYRKAQDRQLARGRSISSLIGACTYISCRDHWSSLSLTEVAEQTNVKRNDLAKMYRTVVVELDLKVPMIDPMKCIARIASKAGLSETTKRQAILIMDDAATEGKRGGKNPMGIAASILYLVCLTNGERTNQGSLAEAAGITEVTLRNRLKDLRQGLIAKYPELLLNKDNVLPACVCLFVKWRSSGISPDSMG